MSTNNNLLKNEQNVKQNFEYDEEMDKLRKELSKKFQNYHRLIHFLAADAPISVLCLPSVTENILINNGFLRVYDLFDMDFTKIKGLGSIRIRDLTTRLDEFIAMF